MPTTGDQRVRQWCTLTVFFAFSILYFPLNYVEPQSFPSPTISAT